MGTIVYAAYKAVNRKWALTYIIPLFFNDSTTLADIVEAPTYSAEATEIYERLANERQQLESDPFYEPKWGSSLVAVEPETAVTYQNEPYILPILDSRDALFDGATDTVLLKVAAVPAGAMDIADRDNASLRGDNLEVRAGEDGEFRIGVVFVMDTTISMAPFIERLHQTVKGFFDAFERYESAAFVSFGLVGFRDDTRPDPERLEYVVEIFQPLDPEADARQVLTNVLQMKEATVPTIGSEEDGLYGIRMAMAEMDWEAFDVRLIVFVTDASSRVGNDPHGATYETPETIAEYGRNNSMVIIPIHLLTPANQSNQDAAKAERQYRTLSETGDLALDKYIALNAESDQEFAQGLNTIADLAARGALNANAGQLISPEEMERSFEGSSSAVQQLGRAVANEIFRAQLESLATVGGGDAPSFLEGWAADRDLTDPDIRTLEVSVFLTRNQLSTLDRRLGLIVDAFRSGGDSPPCSSRNCRSWRRRHRPTPMRRRSMTETWFRRFSLRFSRFFHTEAKCFGSTRITGLRSALRKDRSSSKTSRRNEESTRTYSAKRTYGGTLDRMIQG